MIKELLRKIEITAFNDGLPGHPKASLWVKIMAWTMWRLEILPNRIRKMWDRFVYDWPPRRRIPDYSGCFSEGSYTPDDL